MDTYPSKSEYPTVKSLYRGLPIHKGKFQGNSFFKEISLNNAVKDLFGGDEKLPELITKRGIRDQLPKAESSYKGWDNIPFEQPNSEDVRYRAYSPILKDRGTKPNIYNEITSKPKEFSEGFSPTHNKPSDLGSEKDERDKLLWEQEDYDNEKYPNREIFKWANSEKPQSFFDYVKDKKVDKPCVNCWEAAAVRLSKNNVEIKDQIKGFGTKWSNLKNAEGEEVEKQLKAQPAATYFPEDVSKTKYGDEDKQADFYELLGFDNPDQLDMVYFEDVDNYPFQKNDIVSTKFNLKMTGTESQYEKSPYELYEKIGGHVGYINKAGQFESLGNDAKGMTIPTQNSFKEYLEDLNSIRPEGHNDLKQDPDKYTTYLPGEYAVIVSKKFREQPISQAVQNTGVKNPRKNTIPFKGPPRGGSLAKQPTREFRKGL